MENIMTAEHKDEEAISIAFTLLSQYVGLTWVCR